MAATNHVVSDRAPAYGNATTANQQRPGPENRWIDANIYAQLAREIQQHNANRICALGSRSPRARLALDLGCGTGFVSQELIARDLAARVIGVDISPDMLGVARAALANDRVDFVAANLLDVALPEPADAAYSNAAMHWLYPHYGQFLSRTRESLSPGGRLYLATAGRSAASDRFDAWMADVIKRTRMPAGDTPFQDRRMTPAALRHQAEENGFVTEDAFLIERWIKLPARTYADWLIASGGPWTCVGTETGNLRRRLAEAMSLESDIVELGHWTSVLVACHA